MRDFSRDSPASSGTRRRHIYSDLDILKTRIFLQTGLDRANQLDPAQEINVLEQADLN
jgi:hypothetical protein